jgi:hypothetical protein
MLKRAESLDPLPQCRLELRLLGKRLLEPEDLPRGRTRVVEHEQAIAKAIRVPLRIPGGQAAAAFDHGSKLVDDQISGHSHGASILRNAVPKRQATKELRTKN